MALVFFDRILVTIKMFVFFFLYSSFVKNENVFSKIYLEPSAV